MIDEQSMGMRRNRSNITINAMTLTNNRELISIMVNNNIYHASGGERPARLGLSPAQV